jgi:signal transduction histidine kinase
MKENLLKIKDFLGPYDYRAGFIYFTILIFNLSNLRSFTFDYDFGWARIEFFLIGLLTYMILGLPLYLSLQLLQIFWRGRNKIFSVYLLELLIGSLITLISIKAGQKFLIPILNIEDFLISGVFLGEVITRFCGALIFVAITHGRLRDLGYRLEMSSQLNKQLKERYSQLIDSDEEIRSHASQLLHDRIQSKLMLSAAKLTRITGMLTEEGKLGIQPVIKELEHIRSIDIREVSQLLSPNLAGEGLIGSCENLCREYRSELIFTFDIDEKLEQLEDEIKLGIYRIIEQGVINAIKHGPAANVQISAKQGIDGLLVIEVRDDGPGSKVVRPGKGTVIIDSWVSKLGGIKVIESHPGSGFILRVLLAERM